VLIDEPGEEEADTEDELMSSLNDCMPPGWQLLSPPHQLDIMSLTGRKLLFYWQDYGWALANIRKTYRVPKAGKYNVETKYTSGEVYDQHISLATYFQGNLDDVVPGSWTLLERS